MAEQTSTESQSAAQPEAPLQEQPQEQPQEQAAASDPAARPSNFVNVGDLALFSTADFKQVAFTGDQWEHTAESQDKYGIRYRSLTPIVQASGLGASYCELPPDKASWPFHYHMNNEESVFIISGEGVMCVREGDFPVKTGDYINFPAGPAHAHRLINTSQDTTLRYLTMSTNNKPDVVVYPSTGKFAVFDFEGEVGMKFFDLKDSGLPYYQVTPAANSAYNQDAKRLESTARLDFAGERPAEKPQEPPRSEE